MLKNKHYIEVLGQPMGKQRPRACMRGGYAHIYTPKETTNYENLIKLTWQEKYGRTQLDGALYVNIVANLSLNKSDYKKNGELTKEGQRKINGLIKPTKKPDCDNLAKVIDGLNTIAFKDDSQIVSLTIKKYYSTQPSLYIEIWEEKNSNEEVNDNNYE